MNKISIEKTIKELEEIIIKACEKDFFTTQERNTINSAIQYCELVIEIKNGMVQLLDRIEVIENGGDKNFKYE